MATSSGSFRQLPQIGGRRFVEATIHLAGVDQIFALPPADVDAVPLVSIERLAGDGQRLSAARRSSSPSYCRGRSHRRRPGPSTPTPSGRVCRRARTSSRPPKLEAFAELDVGVGDDLLQFGLAPDQRLLPDAATVQVGQVERHQNDTLALQLKFDELVLATKDARDHIAGIEKARDERIEREEIDVRRKASKKGSDELTPRA
jgi:hypothetical protein